ncbi:hypothetical protein ABH977_008258 [Bradyrhizobium ottawaense]
MVGSQAFEAGVDQRDGATIINRKCIDRKPQRALDKIDLSWKVIPKPLIPRLA